jgi:hypothetical protein
MGSSTYTQPPPPPVDMRPLTKELREAEKRLHHFDGKLNISFMIASLQSLSLGDY